MENSCPILCWYPHQKRLYPCRLALQFFKLCLARSMTHHREPSLCTGGYRLPWNPSLLNRCFCWADILVTSSCLKMFFHCENLCFSAALPVSDKLKKKKKKMHIESLLLFHSDYFLIASFPEATAAVCTHFCPARVCWCLVSLPASSWGLSWPDSSFAEGSSSSY